MTGPGKVLIMEPGVKAVGISLASLVSNHGVMELRPPDGHIWLNESREEVKPADVYRAVVLRERMSASTVAEITAVPVALFGKYLLAKRETEACGRDIGACARPFSALAGHA